MIWSALQRTESRGVHFRGDFPERDDAHWREARRLPGEAVTLWRAAGVSRPLAHSVRVSFPLPGRGLLVFGEDGSNRFLARFQRRQLLELLRRRTAVVFRHLQCFVPDEKLLVRAFDLLAVIGFLPQQLLRRIVDADLEPIVTRRHAIVVDVHDHAAGGDLLLAVKGQLVHADLIGVGDEESVEHRDVIEPIDRRESLVPGLVDLLLILCVQVHALHL